MERDQSYIVLPDTIEQGGIMPCSMPLPAGHPRGICREDSPQQSDQLVVPITTPSIAQPSIPVTTTESDMALGGGGCLAVVVLGALGLGILLKGGGKGEAKKEKKAPVIVNQGSVKGHDFRTVDGKLEVKMRSGWHPAGGVQVTSFWSGTQSAEELYKNKKK